MFNPYYGLFQYSKDTQYTLEINPDSGINPVRYPFIDSLNTSVLLLPLRASLDDDEMDEKCRYFICTN